MGMGRFRAKIEVFSIDELTAADRERLAGFVERARAGAEAGVARYGECKIEGQDCDGECKLQGYFIGQMHNLGVLERFTTLSEFTGRMGFLERLGSEPTEYRRIERIIERDGYSGKHLPARIEELCAFNGHFRKGCLDQTENFYERLMLLKARDYLDSLLGPAEEALDDAPAYRSPDLPDRRL